VRRGGSGLKMSPKFEMSRPPGGHGRPVLSHPTLGHPRQARRVGTGDRMTLTDIVSGISLTKCYDFAFSCEALTLTEPGTSSELSRL
jgi:hypothetical protein